MASNIVSRSFRGVLEPDQVKKSGKFIYALMCLVKSSIFVKAMKGSRVASACILSGLLSIHYYEKNKSRKDTFTLMALMIGSVLAMHYTGNMYIVIFAVAALFYFSPSVYLITDKIQLMYFAMMLVRFSGIDMIDEFLMFASMIPIGFYYYLNVKGPVDVLLGGIIFATMRKSLFPTVLYLTDTLVFLMIMIVWIAVKEF